MSVIIGAKSIAPTIKLKCLFNGLIIRSDMTIIALTNLLYRFALTQENTTSRIITNIPRLIMISRIRVEAMSKFFRINIFFLRLFYKNFFVLIFFQILILYKYKKNIPEFL